MSVLRDTALELLERHGDLLAPAPAPAGRRASAAVVALDAARERLRGPAPVRAQLSFDELVRA